MNSLKTKEAVKFKFILVFHILGYISCFFLLLGSTSALTSAGSGFRSWSGDGLLN
jgi:hypothetical protein